MIDIGMKIDDRYRVTSRIAHGGMADVYEAYDILMHRTVALKIMRTDMINEVNIERFEKEGIVSASLDSPLIVKVYGQGKVDGRPYMVNEYVEGRTLRDKLNVSTGHNLTPLEAIDVMLQLTEGVSYVHEHGILHRDLKPDNLFYLSDGSIKIADFGIAMKIGESDESDGVAGTIYYCAPETLVGQKPNVTSDIYSMGVIFFELLTGTVPFEGETTDDIAIAQIKKHFPEPSKIVPSLPKVLDKIVVKACRKSPDERYQSSKEMHDAIKKTLENEDKLKERKSLFSRIFGFK